MRNVRTRFSSPDPFNGARGHEYIKLRGLAQRVPFRGEQTANGDCQCPPCVSARLLPAVQRICRQPHERRQPSILQEVRWNDLTCNLAPDLLALELEA